MSDFQRLNLNNIQNPSLRRVCQVTRQTPLELWSTFAERFGTQGPPRLQGDDHLPQVPMSTPDLLALLGFGQDLPKAAERCQPEQVLPGVLTAEELGAHREVDPVQLPDEGTTMNPSQLPGFVDLQWLDNLPFPDPFLHLHHPRRPPTHGC